MSAWIYIASGIGAFIVFVLMFVWDSVNGEVNHSEGWDG